MTTIDCSTGVLVKKEENHMISDLNNNIIKRHCPIYLIALQCSIEIKLCFLEHSMACTLATFFGTAQLTQAVLAP